VGKNYPGFKATTDGIKVALDVVTKNQGGKD
jgi:hypothetical protein